MPHNIRKFDCGIKDTGVWLGKVCTGKTAHTAAYELLEHAVKEFLGAKCGIPPLCIAKTEDGKPYFDCRPDIFFSISHCGQYAAVAVSRLPVGIDIEKIRPVCEKIVSRWLLMYLDIPCQNCTDADKIRAWTKRESFGKLTGKGFFEKSLPVSQRFLSWNCPDGYITTLCIGEPAAETRDGGTVAF